MLLKQQQGEELIEFCRSGRQVTVHFTVKEDPKIRSLPRKLCQECAAIFSGIGVLYTVIQCFKVRVGAEAGVQILAFFFLQSFLCFLVSDQMFLLGETLFCSFFLYFFQKMVSPLFRFQYGFLTRSQKEKHPEKGVTLYDL